VLEGVPTAAGALVALLISVISVVLISPLLALWLALSAAGSVWAASLMTGRVASAALEERATAVRLGSAVTDTARGMEALRATGSARGAILRLRELSVLSEDAVAAHAKAQANHEAVVALLSGLLFGTSVTLAALTASSSGGSAAAIALLVFLVDYIMLPVQSIGFVLRSIASAAPSLERVKAVCLNEASSPAVVIESADGGLVLQGITYGALGGLDLEARPGEVVGVKPDTAEEGAALLRLLSAPAPAQRDVEGRIAAGIEAGDNHVRIIVENGSPQLFRGSIS
jgi:putative ABC transport system ATP-binding protein